jgi:leader peptidase (prepilin peptidase)/N-methyltransferase
MIRILTTVFTALVGLAFGSFLNVCLSRWPAGESVVQPRSHCRTCSHTLAWWENVPLLSWLALRGRCRGCHERIGWRYPLVEFAVGALWAGCWYRLFTPETLADSNFALAEAGLAFAGFAVFYWLLVGLAVLDAEHLWLPDALTVTGIVLGVLLTVMRGSLLAGAGVHSAWLLLLKTALGILAAGGLILLIRWIYWLIRRREGMGLGDAKLMALLAAWLGLPGALVAFGLGVVLGAAVGLALLAVPSPHGKPGSWALTKLPLGTFLCVGGVASGLWGDQILAAYLRWAGF